MKPGNSSSADRDERVLARILQEIDEQGPQSVDVHKYTAEYPHLEEEIDELLRMRNVLEYAGTTSTQTMPQQLGEFRIVRKMAHGGMGDIFEAIQESIDRRVVIKTIRHGRISPEAEQRFEREQKILARLHQTNIVPIHSAGREGNLQYFSMPYIEGATLHHVIQAAWDFDSRGSDSESFSLGDLAELAALEKKATPQGTETRIAEEIQPNNSHSEDDASANISQPIVLSIVYFRSVAKVIADLTEALQHAHDVQILHRDLKPSNMMVNSREQSWIIDFGLGQIISESGEKANGAESESSLSSGKMGTPRYMAPEQFNDMADVRTDVWGLGVTLYEMLVLRPPFVGTTITDTKESICQRSPDRPRSLVPNLPRELEAIVLKAVEKNPEDRYQTVADFGRDLRNWLNDESTTAMPPTVAMRLWKWTRRNKGWATSLSLLVLLAISLIVSLQYKFAVHQHEARVKSQATALTQSELKRQQAELFAKSRELELKKQEVLAQGREAERQRLMVQASKQIMLPEMRLMGWVSRTQNLLRNALAIRPDTDIRDHFAATLSGLDADLNVNISVPATRVAFNAQESKLLLSGTNVVWLVDIATGERKQLPGALRENYGPIGFDANGQPLMISAVSPWEWQIIDLEKHDTYRTLSLPQKYFPEGLVKHWERIPAEEHAPYLRGLNELAQVTPEMSHLIVGADIIQNPPSEQVVAIFDCESGTCMQVLPAIAASFAIDDGHTLFAIGAEQGEVTIRRLGDDNPLRILKTGLNRVTTLDWGRQSGQSDEFGREGIPSGLLIAAGDDVGGLTVWDIADAAPLATFERSPYRVNAVRFNDDSTILASATQGGVNLWDTLTGKRLIGNGLAGGRRDIEFSKDGNRLLVPGNNHDLSHCTKLWNLNQNRGIHTLRGMRESGIKVVFSPDSRLIAGQMNDWSVGIWKVESGRLSFRLQARPGFHHSSSALAFSNDSRHFFFAAAGEMSAWDMDTGQRSVSWTLPHGLADQMGVDDNGRILLFRQESVQNGAIVIGSPEWHQEPLPSVFRLREMHMDGTNTLMEEYPVLHAPGTAFTACSRDGRYFVGSGMAVTANRAGIINGVDGKIERYLPLQPFGGSLMLVGQKPGYLWQGVKFDVPDRANGYIQWQQFRLDTGTLINSYAYGSAALGPKLHIGLSTDGPPGACHLFDHRTDTRILTVPSPVRSSQFHPDISPDGRYAAWASDDGTVSVMELERVRKTLSDIGMGWKP